MITDEELMKRIDQVSTDFHGQLDDLNEVVGIILMGRMYGWRVQRLVVSRRIWMLTAKLFGDPKKLMPAEGHLAYKSFGLKVVKVAGNYWDFVAGNVNRDSLPLKERKMI